MQPGVPRSNFCGSSVAGWATPSRWRHQGATSPLLQSGRRHAFIPPGRCSMRHGASSRASPSPCSRRHHFAASDRSSVSANRLDGLHSGSYRDPNARRVLRLTFGVLVRNDLFGKVPLRLDQACCNGHALARIGVPGFGIRLSCLSRLCCPSLAIAFLSFPASRLTLLRSHPCPMLVEAPHLRAN